MLKDEKVTTFSINCILYFYGLNSKVQKFTLSPVLRDHSRWYTVEHLVTKSKPQVPVLIFCGI